MVRSLMPTQRLDAEPNALVSNPIELDCWSPLRRQIEVPAGYEAVLLGPNGSVQIVGEGLRHVPWRWCSIRLVDMRRHLLSLPAVSALTADGWQASIQAAIEYAICSSRVAVQCGEPLAALREAALSAVTAIIRATAHDRLIGADEHGMPDSDPPQSQIHELLQTAVRRSGIRIANVFVTQPAGDERRLEIRRQSQVAETQLAADQSLVSGQVALAREQQALAVLQAETRRKQVEEEQQARLKQAEIDAEVAAMLQNARELEARLALIPDLSRQRHEKLIEAIHVYGQIFGKLVELSQIDTFSVSAHRRPEELGWDRLREVFSEGLDHLQALVSGDPANPPHDELGTFGEGLAYMHLSQVSMEPSAS